MSSILKYRKEEVERMIDRREFGVTMPRSVKLGAEIACSKLFASARNRAFLRSSYVLDADALSL